MCVCLEVFVDTHNHVYIYIGLTHCIIIENVTSHVCVCVLWNMLIFWSIGLVMYKLIACL